MEVLDSIPFTLDTKSVFKHLRLRRETERMERVVQELIEIVRPVAKPKAVYEVSCVDNKDEDSLYIGGVKFTSRVLRVNLDKVERVFPYVATCGRELDEVTVPSDDFMKYYCFDAIKEMAVRSAHSYLQDYLTRNYALGKMSRMSPGELEDWPITQQKELFSVFGNVKDLIGVKLTESLLMVPLKSMSGICFPSEIRFESCQLCPRETCIERKVPYDLELVKKYRLTTKTY